jgi:hypothetical protein
MTDQACALVFTKLLSMLSWSSSWGGVAGGYSMVPKVPVGLLNPASPILWLGFHCIFLVHRAAW